MKISGFTFLRNAHKLYYPIQESILSILDLVDEFVIALGEGDDGDNSLEILTKINSPKIKIIHTKWDLEKYNGGTIYAQQTDFAKAHCSGDWLFYLQGDEVIHEDDISEVKQACELYLNQPKVEGFIFNYLHFWGDYDHYFSDHCWYKKEIRIIRNLPEVHSWRDAQSFRVIPGFTENDYLRKQNTRKLNVIALNARVFHYGWVRPPELMKTKNDSANSYYNKNKEGDAPFFDYGRMDRVPNFKGTHPEVMNEKVKELYWQDKLRYEGPEAKNRPIMKHEKLKYRIISLIEKHFLGGRVIGGFKNYKII